ncbi:unnamed protein product [Lampetra fluviatilis]
MTARGTACKSRRRTPARATRGSCHVPGFSRRSGGFVRVALVSCEQSDAVGIATKRMCSDGRAARELSKRSWRQESAEKRGETGRDGGEAGERHGEMEGDGDRHHPRRIVARVARQPAAHAGNGTDMARSGMDNGVAAMGGNLPQSTATKEMERWHQLVCVWRVDWVPFPALLLRALCILPVPRARGPGATPGMLYSGATDCGHSRPARCWSRPDRWLPVALGQIGDQIHEVRPSTRFAEA